MATEQVKESCTIPMDLLTRENLEIISDMDLEYLSLTKSKSIEENGLLINSMDKAKLGTLQPSIKRKAKYLPLLSPSGLAIAAISGETDSKEKALYISREDRSF